MHPIHDADLLLLLAITLASKRRPAAVDDIAIALGTLQPRLPAEAKLLDAFERLTRHGLVLGGADGYALSDEGQALMRQVPAKGETAERAARLKAALATWEAGTAQAGVKPDAAVLSAAVAAWRASLPPPTKSEKVAQQRETRFQESNAKRIAEGKRPRPPRPAEAKRPGRPGRAANAGFGSPKRSARGR